jgi:sugar transferase (PEP-CTERM system associated)
MRSVRVFNHHVKIGFLVLGGVEVLLLGASVYVAAILRLENVNALGEAAPLWSKAALFAAVMGVSLIASGLYQQNLREGMLRMGGRLAASLLLGGLGVAVVVYVVPELYLGRGVLVLAGGLAFLGLLTCRSAFSMITGQEGLRSRVLVLGTGQRAAALASMQRKGEGFGMDVVGYLRLGNEATCVPEPLVLEREGESLCRMARRMGVDELVVALEDRRNVLPVEDLLKCRLNGTNVTELPTFLERETGKVKLDLIHPSWLTYTPGFFHRGLIRRIIKRFLDITGALALLPVAAPLMGLTALAIFLESGSPVLFRQSRVGEGGRTFTLLKFRSMRADAEKDGQARWAAENDPRITPLGRFLRTYRLDELPQLFNILRGDMSFVGPRPERPEFEVDLQRELPYYPERHLVKPGLTGWAQISYPYGASKTDAFEKLQYDLYYVKNFSLVLDLMILLQTAEIVLWGKGAR